MGHYIHAIVGHKPINENKLTELGLAAIYESEFVIIPLIEENIHYFEIENDIDSEDFGDDVIWDCTTTLLFARLLGLEKHVIMTLSNPDFLGSYYEGNDKIVHETGIEIALHHLGVPKKNGSEYEYLNLNDYRNSEFYYMDKIIGKHRGSNIIKGTTLYPDYSKGE